MNNIFLTQMNSDMSHSSDITPMFSQSDITPMFSQSDITPTEYCDNPEKNYEFVKDFTPEEFQSLTEYCKEYEFQKESIKGKIGTAITDFGKELENLPEIVVEMIHSMFFTKEGLENIALIFGVRIGSELIAKIGAKILLKGVEITTRILGELAEISARFAAEFVLDMGLEVFASSIVSVLTTELFVNGVLSTIPVIGEVLDAAIDVVFLIVDEIMFLAMFLDMWDPLGFDGMLNAEVLRSVSNGFNNIFYSIATTGLNRPEGDNWPIQYYADNLVFTTKLDDNTENELLVLRKLWSTQYLQSLQFNSLGNRIIPFDNSININLGEFSLDSLYSQRIVSALNQSSYMIKANSGDNPFFGGIIEKYWFIILVLLSIIFIYLITVKK